MLLTVDLKLMIDFSRNVQQVGQAVIPCNYLTLVLGASSQWQSQHWQAEAVSYCLPNTAYCDSSEYTGEAGVYLIVWFDATTPLLETFEPIVAKLSR
jgi:hypothetical protein